eukprot:5888243-Prymnesium_polylepis.1
MARRARSWPRVAHQPSPRSFKARGRRERAKGVGKEIRERWGGEGAERSREGGVEADVRREREKRAGEERGRKEREKREGEERGRRERKKGGREREKTTLFWKERHTMAKRLFWKERHTKNGPYRWMFQAGSGDVP